MEKSLSEIVSTLYSQEDRTPPESLQKELESYKHIQLTNEEMAESLLAALKKKERKIEEEAIHEAAERNRKMYTSSQWTISQTISYMKYRASKIFTKQFIVDDTNLALLEFLTAYFSKDNIFISLAEKMGVKNPSLEKGILLGGPVGVGKTTMMTLFSKNQRRVFQLVNAIFIADGYLEGGVEYLNEIANRKQLPINDFENLYQREMGLCVDDFGSEMMKNSYGNKKNVLGELVEHRYALGNMGEFLHITTNLTMGQVKEFYGERVSSRLREAMNVVEFKGEDRRK